MANILERLENSSDDQIRRSKLQIDKIKNPPVYEDGMEELGNDEDDFDDLFDMNKGTNGIVGNFGMGLNPLLNPMGNKPTQSKSQEEEIIDFAKNVAKSTWSGTKKLYKFLRSKSLKDWTKILSRSLIVEAVLLAIWILFLLFGVKRFLFIPTLSLIVMTLVAGGVTVIAFGFIGDYLTSNGGASQDNTDQSSEDYEYYEDYDEDMGETVLIDEEDGENFLTSNNIGGDDVKTFDFSGFDTMYSTPKGSDILTYPEDDIKELIQTIKENRISSRQELFNIYTKILPKYTPDYDEKKPITEDSNLFHSINARCTDAIHAVTNKKLEPEDDTYLIEAYHTKFYILAKMKRIAGCNNTDAIAKEVASFFKEDYDDQCYAHVETLGNAYVIKIYIMENVLISIADMFKNETVKKEFMDDSYTFPAIIGITETGKPIIRDLAKLESFIVAGMPRSGKSWTVLLLLTQLAMFNSPEDIQFVILDPKSEISDYRYFKIPHVLCWYGEKKQFLNIIEDLVKREADQRSKLLGEHECVNIFEFRERHPDKKLPIIYLVLEEVVTFAESLTKEDKDRFDALMLELASRLPALGIRTILVPHVAKHQFLNKSVKDIIPFRCSIKGGEEHIKQTLDVKKFDRRLINKGDMALKIDAEAPIYAKAPVITDNPLNNQKVFEFISRLWEGQGYSENNSPALLRIIELGKKNKEVKLNNGDY